MESSDESTNKVKRIEPEPQHRPIPSVLQRNAAPKPAPAFTWPLSTPKPVAPIARTPVGAKVVVPAVVRPTAAAPMRAPRGTDAPPPAPTPVPVIVIPTPAPVIVAPAPAPVIVAPTPAPVIVAPTPAPIAPAPTFGAGMLQGRRSKPMRDDVASISAAPAFGAGMLQARSTGGKKLLIMFGVALAIVAGLCIAMRSGESHHASAPTTTSQP